MVYRLFGLEETTWENERKMSQAEQTPNLLNAKGIVLKRFSN